MFAVWIFFALTAASVFVLRRKMPDAPRPYKVIGYPVLPALFVVVALWLLINTLRTSPVESAAGLVLIATHFKQLLVTRETQAKPHSPGAIVLQGALNLPSA